MKWAKRDNPALVIPDMITAADWKPRLQNRERVYSLEELAALLGAARARQHWHRFMILAIATASREAAIRELRWEQVDMRAASRSIQREECRRRSGGP